MAESVVNKLGFKECQEYNLGLWQCPSFLFVVMGIINVVSILATYVIAVRYDSPELGDRERDTGERVSSSRSVPPSSTASSRWWR